LETCSRWRIIYPFKNLRLNWSSVQWTRGRAIKHAKFYGALQCLFTAVSCTIWWSGDKWAPKMDWLSGAGHTRACSSLDWNRCWWCGVQCSKAAWGISSYQCNASLTLSWWLCLTTHCAGLAIEPY
jgi:hypothetical protein